jgi:hypothetical protein
MSNLPSWLNPRQQWDFFNQMTDQDAAHFLQEYLGSKEDRLRNLRDRFQMTAEGRAETLDFTPLSLVPLWAWATKHLHRREHTQEERELIMGLPEPIRSKQLSDQPLSDDSVFLINDIAYYLAEVCIRNLPGVHWDVCKTDIPFFIDKNQPVLKGFTLISQNPLGAVHGAAIKTVDGRAGSEELLNIYRNWKQCIKKSKQRGRNDGQSSANS